MQLKLSAILPATALILASTVIASKHSVPLKARSHRNLARLNSNELEKRGGGGTNAPGTYYNVLMGEVACGGYYQPNDLIVAMNSPDFDGGAACGKTITIQYRGKTMHATVRDECPTCGPHGIDMSEGLFTSFASTYIGEIYVDWYFGGGDPPAPTHTKAPPPPPPSPTTHHTEPKTTSTSTHHSSSPASSSSSASASPSTTPVVPSGANNIAALFQAVVGLGEVVTFAAGN